MRICNIRPETFVAVIATLLLSFSANANEGTLRFSSSDEIHGVSGRFEAGNGETVLFESRRLAAHSHGEKQSQERAEVIARLYSPEGFTIASFTDGTDVPEEWRGNSDAGHGLKKLGAAISAGQRISHSLKGDTLAPERIAFTELTKSLTQGMAMLKQEREKNATNSSTSYALATSSCSYRQNVGLHSRQEKYWVFPNVWDSFNYDHVTTTTYYISYCSGTWSMYDLIQKCNHKGCNDTSFYQTYIGPLRSRIPFPYSCDDNGGSFSRASYRHLSANDAFLELGNIMAGYKNSRTTYERICWNKNYRAYTGISYKSRPWTSHVSNFINRYGWEPVDDGSSGGGSGGGGTPPIDEPNCGPHAC